MAVDYTTMADQAATRYGVPPQIFRGLITTESSWNPNAKSNSSSAYGFTQLLSGTAKDLGVDRYDPAQNLDGGAKYLSQQYAKFGNWNDALAAYRVGPGNVNNPEWSETGKNYASKILGALGTVGDIRDKVQDVVKKADEAFKKGYDKFETAKDTYLGTITGGLLGGKNIFEKFEEWWTDYIAKTGIFRRGVLVWLGVSFIIIAGIIVIIGQRKYVSSIVSKVKG